MIPKLRDDLQMIKEECYRGDFEQILELPSHVYFDKIHSTLTAENILMITVPKVIQPEKISIKVQYE
jgi:HSP20 family molecular chaperone IbpA